MVVSKIFNFLPQEGQTVGTKEARSDSLYLKDSEETGCMYLQFESEVSNIQIMNYKKFNNTLYAYCASFG